MNKEQQKRLELHHQDSIMRDMDLFGIGNPIVDIVAHVDEKFIESNNLPKNSTILADIQHEGIFDEIANNYDIEYSPGCSVQNALRFCQWVVGKNNSVATYIGAVGNDYFGNVLAVKVKADGLCTRYLKDDNISTGICAILYYNDAKNKTIITNLGASKKMTKSFVNSNFWFCEKSRVILVSGHSIPVSAESVLWLAKHAHEWGKDFFFNLGAVYVIQKYTNVLVELLPYIDFLFCNAEEALAFATMKGMNFKDLKQVARLLADEPRKYYENTQIPNNYKSIRIVVITQKDKPVLMAQTMKPEVKEYALPQLDKDQFKDTCGCGDALIGGFLAMYIDGHDLDLCMKCGIYCATQALTQIGTTLPKDMNFEIP